MATTFSYNPTTGPVYVPPTISSEEVLAQVYNPDETGYIPERLKTQTVQTPKNITGGGFTESQKVSSEYEQYATRVPYTMGGFGGNINEYKIPTGQTFQGQPLIATYDAQGNFQYAGLPEGQTLTPDPSQPNILSQPRFNSTGGITNYGVFDVNQQDSGGFGSFIGDLVKDFGPMILAGLSANYLAGSGLFTGAGATTGGATAAQLAAGSTANFMNPALISSAGGAGGAAATSAAGAGLLNSGATTAGGANFLNPQVVANAGGSGATPSILQSISNATGIDVETLKTFAPSVIQGLTGAAGSALTAEQAKEAARTQADAQVRAAQIAADAARFRPVGVTTRFGSSNFTTDAAGNVVTAGYTPSAEITGYQDRLRALAGQGLTDAEGARAAFQPLTGAAQSLFGLGQSYLAKTPEQAAADYISKQQALIAPSQENQLAQLQNKLFQQGRGGAATAQGGSLMATSPELAAYYNSLAQSNLVLAAQADQEAQNRIKFGAGLFDTGANLQGRFYTGQTAALAPFTTAMDTSLALESLAERPLGLGIELGGRVSAAAGRAGAITGQGITSAASTMAPANAYSGAGNLFSGIAQSPNFNSALGQAFGVPQPKPSQDAYGAQTFRYDAATGQYIPYKSTFS